MELPLVTVLGLDVVGVFIRDDGAAESGGGYCVGHANTDGVR